MDDALEFSELARKLGRRGGLAKSDRKAAAARVNALQSGGRPTRPLAEIPCTCGAGAAAEGHKSRCARGMAIKRRQAAGKPLVW